MSTIDLDHQPAGEASPAELPPLPKRVADDEQVVDDPVGFVDDLLERTAVLLATFERDVADLKADQEKERARIEAMAERQRQAADDAVTVLADLHHRAVRLAQQKARTAEFTRALETPTYPGPEVQFDAVVARVRDELRLAKGITGTIRLPEIGRLLNEAAQVVKRMEREAEDTRQRLISGTFDELRTEGKEARASFEIGMMVLRRDLDLLDEALAAAALPFDHPSWATWAPGPPRRAVVRLGSYVHDRLPHTPIPALFDLDRHGSLRIDATGRTERGVAAVRALLLRLLAAAPPGGLRFTLIDPVGLGESVAPLLALAEIDETLIDGGVCSLDEDIEARLEALTHHVEQVIQRDLRGQHPTLRHANLAAGEPVEADRVVVVFDHPSGFGDRANQLLRNLSEHGARAGVFTIVVRDLTNRYQGNRSKGSGAGGLAIDQDGDDFVVHTERAGTWRVVPDDPPPMALGKAGSELFTRVLTTAGNATRSFRQAPLGLGKVYELLAHSQALGLRADLPDTSDVVDPERPDTWWRGDARRSLGVPIGRTSGHEVATLHLDGATTPGALVLASDGDELTSLLHDVVLGLACLYPPDELRLTLVGLRPDGGFGPYGTHQLPHARVVGSEADRELGLSVLELLIRAIDQRQAAFRTEGVERPGYARYRELTGKPLPRVLAVVDGYDRLLGPSDRLADQAQRLLARVLDEGPSSGIHVVLAATLPSDAAELLRCTPDRLRRRLVLTEEEPAAALFLGVDPAELPARAPGDALLGTAGGERPVAVRPARTDAHDRAVSLRDLTRLARARKVTNQPEVVEGATPARLELAPLARLAQGGTQERAERRRPRLWLGAPAALGGPVEVVLSRRDGANLLVVGDDDELAQGVLLGALTTAVLGSRPTIAVDVLDLGSLESGFSETVALLGDLADVQVSQRRSLDKVLDRVHRTVQDRHTRPDYAAPPLLLAVNALHRARELGAGADDVLDPAEVLTAILRDGPEVGVHTLVWCDDVGTLERRLPRAAVREFGVRVVTAMSEADSNAMIDSPSAAQLSPTQALLHDEDHRRLVKFRPFAPPGRDWLATLVAAG